MTSQQRLEFPNRWCPHQLKLLKLEGQVKSRREGKNVYYSLDDQHVVDIFEEALKHIMHRMEEGNKS